MMEFSQKMVVTGIIMPDDWDENGKVIEIALYTNTEEVYTVEHNSLTGELMNHLYRSVEIKGKIRKHPDGNRSISAHNYIILDETVENE
jgi:cytochrome b subunit of formate dehydrogenase